MTIRYEDDGNTLFSSGSTAGIHYVILLHKPIQAGRRTREITKSA
jgi:hypothetical protein